MNGLHRSSLHYFSVLLVIISGNALPAIDFLRFCNGEISKNLTSHGHSADRITVTGYPIRALLKREHPFGNVSFPLNSENEISITAPIEPGTFKLPANLIQKRGKKTTVIRNNNGVLT